MMGNKNLLFVGLSLSFIFLFSFLVSSQGANTQFSSTTQIGLQIEAPIVSYHEQDVDYDFHIHVHNLTNGSIITNATASCIIHLYNNDVHERIIQSKMNFSGLEFHYNVLGGNFSTLGFYQVVYYCNTTASTGGFFSTVFEVTPNGGVPNRNTTIILFLIIGSYIIALIGYFKENEIIAILGGMFLMGIGLYLYTSEFIVIRDWITEYFSYLTMGIGMYLTYLGIEKLNDVL